MSKMIVKTTGSFILLDNSAHQTVGHARPYVVEMTGYLQQRAATKQLEVLSAALKEDASDAVFKTFWDSSNKQEDLAIAAFLSVWAEGATGAPEANAQAGVIEDAVELQAAQQAVDDAKAALQPLYVARKSAKTAVKADASDANKAALAKADADVEAGKALLKEAEDALAKLKA